MGAPSDHSGVVATPNTSQGQPATRQKICKEIRPLPESLLGIFEARLAAENFEYLRELPVQEMVDTFQNVTTKLLAETFPTKKILVSSEDRPWFNENLRKLKRLRQREYNRHGRSPKYLKIVSNFDEKSKAEMAKYIKKVKLEVTDGKQSFAVLYI